MTPLLKSSLLYLISISLLTLVSCNVLYPGKKPAEDKQPNYYDSTVYPFITPYFNNNLGNTTAQPTNCTTCELMKVVPAHTIPFGDMWNFDHEKQEVDTMHPTPSFLIALPHFFIDSTEITYGDVRIWAGADTVLFDEFIQWENSENDPTRGHTMPYRGTFYTMAFIANARSSFHGLDSVYTYQMVLNEYGRIEELKNFTISNNYGFRLPSYAQWHSACRAGKTVIYPWGNNLAQWNDYAHLEDETREGSLDEWLSPVALLTPNPLGLYDMLGNAAEWVEDAGNSIHYRELAGFNSGSINDTVTLNNPKVNVVSEEYAHHNIHGFTGKDAMDKLGYGGCSYENSRPRTFYRFGARFILELP
ncbi:MAG: formylglycine-generating enzyme family protein [Fibrobacterales bacterium]